MTLSTSIRAVEAFACRWGRPVCFPESSVDRCGGAQCRPAEGIALASSCMTALRRRTPPLPPPRHVGICLWQTIVDSWLFWGLALSLLPLSHIQVLFLVGPGTAATRPVAGRSGLVKGGILLRPPRMHCRTGDVPDRDRRRRGSGVVVSRSAPRSVHMAAAVGRNVRPARIRTCKVSVHGGGGDSGVREGGHRAKRLRWSLPTST
jgi:hypothetical protein